ncbi:hypothetical protein LB456_05405 [Psychroflexus sp. CAK57W]|uniref:hypothetical protein n=1 Tax=Psychroflexus curvus TaxID=2873595 RepID=UPI001CCE92CD|nr:hypothetical protein [Psychroflexus curvus]MBZ9628806.1 hypothetical protein [Psychroflexus curvus]MBZ9786889.1 hypothetical protein [Psychroflexus curvus]
MLTKRFKVLIAIPSVILISLIVAVFVDEEASYLNFYQKPVYIFTMIQVVAFTLVAQQHYIKDKKKTDF